MTRYLPPNLITLFQAREPLPYAEPPGGSQKPPITGVTAYLNAFKSPEEDPNPPPPKVLTKVPPCPHELVILCLHVTGATKSTEA